MIQTSLRTLALLAGVLLITNMPLKAASRQDVRIESAFQQTEIYQDHLRNDRINITSRDGKVTLTGSVATAHHKTLAGDAAGSLSGVSSVSNRLEVNGQRYTGNSRWDKCSNHASCPPTYGDGVPKTSFLQGDAPRICSNGNLGYSGSRRGPIDHYLSASDRSTTQSIREAIYADSSLDRAYNEVSVSTVHGQVTLTGRVGSQAEKNGVQGKAREFVKNDMISNQIAVSDFVGSNRHDRMSHHARGPIDHYQTQADRTITESIRSAIYDDSSLDSAYNDVTISTVRGRVTLNGEVSSSSEKAGIQAKARESVNHDMIDNQIVVAQN